MAYNKTKKDVAAEVTQRIIDDLENGVCPWQKPWREGGVVPMNAVSRKAYRGINVLILWSEAMRQGYNSNRWLTFKQCKEAGGNVRKGQKGTMVVFNKKISRTETDKATGEEKEKSFWLLRHYTVFNLDQCDGVEKLQPAKGEELEFTPIEAAEKIMVNSGANIQHGGHRACYAPAADVIHLPEKTSFKTVEGYYQTAMHELVHWTGHEKRCNRDLSGRFGNEAYAAEELIAEMGAAFTCSFIGMEYTQQHASYIDAWLKVLKSDTRAIITASSKAQQAMDKLTGKTFENVEAGDDDGEAMEMKKAA